MTTTTTSNHVTSPITTEVATTTAHTHTSASISTGHTSTAKVKSNTHTKTTTATTTTGHLTTMTTTTFHMPTTPMTTDLITTIQTTTVQQTDLCCICVPVTYFAYVEITPKIQRHLDMLRKDTEVVKSRLSSFIRKKQCAADTRPTAAYMGYAGGVIFGFLLVLIISFDCLMRRTSHLSVKPSRSFP